MRVIGITGGAGSGKTALLAYIEKKYNCRVLLADQVAHWVKEPGRECYNALVELLSEDILNPDGTIHKGKMAERIFSSRKLLEQTNAIIHPAVKTLILQEIKAEKEKGEKDFFFLEAALLIEDGYLNIVDEMWYIYAEDAVRRRRLMESRGYRKEKIDSLFQSQLSEQEYRKYCGTVIDNSGDFASACRQIDEKLGEYL